MTRRSVTSFNLKLQAAYAKGWREAYERLWNDLQKPEGVTLKNGDVARAHVTPAPVVEAPSTEPEA